MSNIKFTQYAHKADSEISLNYEGFVGLEAMIVKFTRMTWDRIPSPHRRHIDFEDVMQETRMRAYTAISTYDATKLGPNGNPAKLSSWVYGTLALRMREVNAPFTDPSRNQSRTAELASITDFSDAELNARQLIVDETESNVQDAISSFEQAYKESDPATQQMFLDTLGFRTNIRVSGKSAEKSVALSVATKCKLGPQDLRTLRTHGTERCALVAAKLSKPGRKLPEIECVMCSNSFSVAQVGKTIDAKTLVCSNCFEQQLVSPATCFGKEYDAAALECSSFCPDRTVCAEVSVKGAYMGIRVSNGKAKSTPASSAASEVEDDPFAEELDASPAGDPVGTLTIGSDQLEIVDDSTDGHEDEPADGELDEPLDDEPEELDELDTAEPSETFAEELDDPFLADAAEEQPKPAQAAKPSRQKEQDPVPAKSTPVKVVVKTVSIKAVAPAKKTVVIAKTVVASKAKPVTKAVKAAPAKVVAKAVKAPAKAKPAAKRTATKRVLKEFKPQYWTGQHPFRPGTALYTVAETLLAPGGTKMKQLQALVTKLDLNWRGVRHNLAKGKSFNGQWEWKFRVSDEDQVTMKITKRPDAEYKKACGQPVKPQTVLPVKASKGKK